MNDKTNAASPITANVTILGGDSGPHYFAATWRHVEAYLADAVEHLILLCVAYVALCALLYAMSVWRGERDGGELKHAPKRVLFVTAHPDDECMFFGPAIVRLARRPGCQVYLLCLSRGDYDGAGQKRKAELWRACATLGIPSERVTLVHSTLLPDDPHTRWREDLVARIVMNHVEELSIDTVITFDKHGVSLHANHCSIFYALAFLCLDKRIPRYCTVYMLETTNTLRKYWLLLDIPISYLLSSYRFMLSWTESRQVVAAMCQHKSQLVWYRRLFMLFSRYTMMNTLSDMNCIDLELELDVDTND